MKVEVDTSIAYHSSRGKDADNGPLTLLCAFVLAALLNLNIAANVVV